MTESILSPKRRGTSASRRSMVCALLVLISGMMTPVSGNQDDPKCLLVRVEEYQHFKRLLVVQPAEKPIAVPQIRVNRKRGDFFITINPVPGDRFFGTKLIREYEPVPFRMEIQVPDKNTLVLDGKIVDLSQVTAYYDYENRAYVFDIYRDLPPEGMEHLTHLKPANSSIGQLENAQKSPEVQLAGLHPQLARLGKRSGLPLNYLLKAFLISAALILSVGMLYFSVVLMKRSQTAEKKQKPMKPALRERVDITIDQEFDPSVIHAQDIKDEAARKRLSYDEAALLMKMSKGADA